LNKMLKILCLAKHDSKHEPKASSSSLKKEELEVEESRRRKSLAERYVTSHYSSANELVVELWKIMANHLKI